MHFPLEKCPYRLIKIIYCRSPSTVVKQNWGREDTFKKHCFICRLEEAKELEAEKD